MQKEFRLRKMHQNYIDKWDDFKKRREAVIDKYIYYRKK